MKKLSLYVFLFLLMISACSEQNQLSECIEGDCINDYGTAKYANGDKYVGGWKDGARHGQGTYTYANGDKKYIGEYKNSNRHGQGTYTYANGDKYIGEFKDGEHHGQGILTRANGKVEKGIWKKGKLIKK